MMSLLEAIKKHAYILLGGACLFIAGVIYIVAVRGGEEPELYTPQDDFLRLTIDAPVAAARYIIVHVAGEVLSPGVVVLPHDARVQDAIDAAGGATPYLHPHFNLAAPMADGAIVIVPAYFEEVQTVAADTTNYICINTAGVSQLTTLPGIGQARAEGIIAFREANGSFATVEDLTLVPGIGTGILENLRPFITAGG
jgi:competence protein ComEA